MGRREATPPQNDGGDWLLAQLAQAGAGEDADAARSDVTRGTPPAAYDPFARQVSPAAPAAPAPRRDSMPRQPERRGEVLDWFSVAEPPAATSPAPSTPAWAPSGSSQPPVAQPSQPPVAQPSQPPVAQPPNPPVTPPANFALTWGEQQRIDSEDSLRAAFRRLSDPDAAAQPPVGSAPSAWQPAAPRYTAQPTTPAPSAAPPPVNPAPPAWQPEPPAADATSESPFAGYTPPPVARQSFTPLGPDQPAPPITRRTDAYADDVWSALNEDTQAAASPSPQAPAPTPAPAAPVFQPAPVHHTPPRAQQSPVDDMLAALGGQSHPQPQARPRVGTDAWTLSESPVTRAMPVTPEPETFAPGQGANQPKTDGIAVLGLGFAEIDTDAEAGTDTEPDVGTGVVAGGNAADDPWSDRPSDPFHTDTIVAATAGNAFGVSDHFSASQPDTGSSDNAYDDDGAYGDEPAEPTFVWNLVPDPNAPDPRLGGQGAQRVASARSLDDAPVTRMMPIAPDRNEHDDVAMLFAGADASTAASGPQRGMPDPSAPRMPDERPRTPHAGSGGGGTNRPPSSGSSGGGRGGRGGRSPVRILAWVAGGIAAALVLVGLFWVGTQLTGPAPTASPSASITAEAQTPTPAPAPTAPQPAGVHAWDTLFGGECLQPFESPWAEEFTVIDCAAPHAAQLVYRGTLPGDATVAFPGEAALAAQMPELCRAVGVIDVAAASGVPDLQVQGTYPVTEQQWTAGARTYYCFVNRAGGEPLTGSVAGPGPAA